MCRLRSTVSACSSSAVRSVASRLTLPASGRSSPAVRLSSVDLPIPDSPITAMYSPCARSRLTPASTVLLRGPENVLQRLRTESTFRDCRNKHRRSVSRESGLGAEVEALDLAGGRLWQLGHEFHPTRVLIRRQSGLDMGREVL